MNGTIADRLRTKRRVHFDSNAVIYLIEAQPKYLPVVRPLFEFVARGQVEGVTSYLTLVEVLVQPLQQKRFDVATRYRQILSGSRNVRLCPVDNDVAEKAAQLRAAYETEKLRTPDAIQLATALCHGADAFVTNDKHLRKCGSLLDILILENFVAV